MTHLRDAPRDPARSAVQPLDLVVLGGGGHVGLPLSLAFARRRPACRGLRHQRGDARPNRAAGRCRSSRAARDELLASVLETGRLELSADAGIDRAHRHRRPRDRDPGRRVPRTLDARLRASRGPDRAPCPRRRPRRAAQHGLPGHDRVRHRGLRGPGAARGRRLLSGTDRGGPRARGAPHACPRSSERTPLAPATARRRSSPGWRRRPSVRRARKPSSPSCSRTPGATRSSRRQPVLRDRGSGGRGLHQRPARRPRGLSARGGPARAGLRRGPVPVQGHDAAGGLHLGPLPARPGGDADQRGDAGVHRVRPRAAPRDAARARPSASSGWRSRPSRTTSAPRCSFKLRKLLEWTGRTRPVHGPVRRRRRGWSPLDEVLAGSDIVVLGAPHRAYRSLDLGGREVVDIWNATGDGIRL